MNYHYRTFDGEVEVQVKGDLRMEVGILISTFNLKINIYFTLQFSIECSVMAIYPGYYQFISANPILNGYSSGPSSFWKRGLSE